MLGRDLMAAAAARGHEAAGWDLPELDITDPGQVRAAIQAAGPEAVINCAAWTDVDGAETDEAAATTVNGEAAGHVAAAAAAAGALTIQLSTDYVFDGHATEPYTESSPTNPLSAYGRSKLQGEIAVREAAPNAHAIVRSAWLFGAHGRNFVATMLRLGAERDEVTVVDDQVGCPTYTGHLAAGAARRRRAADGRRAARRRRGRVLVVGARRHRVRAQRHRLHRPPRPDRRPRPPRPPPGLLRPALGAPRDAAAAALERRPGRVPGRDPDPGRMRLLVCGGAGFIGSTFVRERLAAGDEVTVLDKLTYAGREENLQDVSGRPGFRFLKGAIEDAAAVDEAAGDADAIVNFAAETHVDRSIAEPDAFVTTHALGTHVLLEAARERGLRFVQVSTDEVYGSIEDGSFTETSPLNPSSPYSATKAGADLLVASYHHTFGLEALVCRGSNNYGPYQYPEKLIPLMVLNALHGDRLPVYGDGMQVRNWIFVEDFARAIATVLERGVPGEVYNVGGPDESPNLEVVERIVELTGGDRSLIEYVTDRPGHDRRYSLASEKVRGLGWEPRVRFAEGLERTVEWYRENRWWWEPIRSGDYRAYYERQYGRALG